MAIGKTMVVAKGPRNYQRQWSIYSEKPQMIVNVQKLRAIETGPSWIEGFQVSKDGKKN